MVFNHNITSFLLAWVCCNNNWPINNPKRRWREWPNTPPPFQKKLPRRTTEQGPTPFPVQMMSCLCFPHWVCPDTELLLSKRKYCPIRGMTIKVSQRHHSTNYTHKRGSPMVKLPSLVVDGWTLLSRPRHEPDGRSLDSRWVAKRCGGLQEVPFQSALFSVRFEGEASQRQHDLWPFSEARCSSCHWPRGR